MFGQGKMKITINELEARTGCLADLVEENNHEIGELKRQVSDLKTANEVLRARAGILEDNQKHFKEKLLNILTQWNI